MRAPTASQACWPKCRGDSIEVFVDLQDAILADADATVPDEDDVNGVAA